LGILKRKKERKKIERKKWCEEVEKKGKE